MSYSVCMFCGKGMGDYCETHVGCARLAKDALIAAQLAIRTFGCNDPRCDKPCRRATVETLALIDDALHGRK